MTPERWAQVEQLYHAARARADDERTTFLDEACAGDSAVRREVESLLAQGSGDRFLSGLMLAAAAPMISHPAETMLTGRRFGPYQIQSFLGAGGMGEVYRARDPRLGRDVAIKILPRAFTSDPERLVRFEREARVLASLNHPHIGAIYGLEEAEGVGALVLELVEGPTLAERLARGAIQLEEAIDIARQIADAVEAAHLKGIIHRDLKPANVKITPSGVVKLLDFGLAKPTVAEAAVAESSRTPTITVADTREGSILGTVTYMSPEQARGQLVDKRTDIWAFGCVLYETLTGRVAFGGNTQADVIAAILGREPDWNALPERTPSSVRRLLRRCLEKDSNDRLRDIGDARLELALERTEKIDAPSRIGTLRWSRTRPVVTLAFLAVILVSMALGVFLRPGFWINILAVVFVSPSARTLTEQDTIILADFENTTGEPVFDGALKVALAVALEQSPFLRVFPDERVRDTLRLMERSADERVTRSIAREVARREQLKALIAGSIASLGRNYVLALEAINAETGDVMAREQAEATSKEQALTSLGKATSRLREKLGESLASVQKFDVPLARATTLSLDALHAYSLALSEGREVPRLEAIPHLKRAIELDPTFAMAHALLSGVYANIGQSALAPAFSQRAFELRDRVSERERFVITWRYYRDAIQDWEKALELTKSWTATYPRDAFAFNSLGSALLRLGQFEQSVEPLQKAIRLDSKFTPAYSNLAASLLALNRFDEAKAILRDAADRKLDFNGARRLSYLLAFIQGDSAMMARELESSVGVRETNAAFAWQAHSSAFAGRVSEAHEQFRRGIQMSLQANFQQVAAELTLDDAEIHAIFGQCAEARREVANGLALSRDNHALEVASLALALCGADKEASFIARELSQRFPDATLTIHVSLPMTAAALAIQRGNPAHGLELLEPARKYDHAPSSEFWPAYLRGQAHLQLKDGRAAGVEFRRILEHRGEVPESSLYPLAHLGLARAAVLASDTATARKAYEDFLTLWNEADSNLHQLQEARREHSRLQ